MLRVTMNGRTRKPSKLSDKCMAAWRVDHLGVTNISRGPTVREFFSTHSGHRVAVAKSWPSQLLR